MLPKGINVITLNFMCTKIDHELNFKDQDCIQAFFLFLKYEEDVGWL